MYEFVLQLPPSQVFNLFRDYRSYGSLFVRCRRIDTGGWVLVRLERGETSIGGLYMRFVLSWDFTGISQSVFGA